MDVKERFVTLVLGRYGIDSVGSYGKEVGWRGRRRWLRHCRFAEGCGRPFLQQPPEFLGRVLCFGNGLRKRVALEGVDLVEDHDGHKQPFFFSSRRRHTRLVSDWSSDVCSSD